MAPGVDGCEVWGGIVSGGTRWPAGSAALTPINGVIIGWVPDASVARVTVAGAGYRGSATVVAQHFILSLPATARAGLPLTVTGLAAAGTAPGTWSVALDDGN